jgi:cadmium resistance protein CadD (predicted permease)
MVMKKHNIFLSAKKYPEFNGKDKKFVFQCLKYVTRKEKLAAQFLGIVAALIVLSLLWNQFAASFIPDNCKKLAHVLFPISIGILFYLYLLYDINTRMHDAVKKHINDFENLINQENKKTE